SGNLLAAHARGSWYDVKESSCACQDRQIIAPRLRKSTFWVPLLACPGLPSSVFLQVLPCCVHRRGGFAQSGLSARQDHGRALLGKPESGTPAATRPAALNIIVQMLSAGVSADRHPLHPLVDDGPRDP